MATRYKIFGVKELDQFFNNMSRADQRRIVQGSFKIGSKPLIQATRRNLKVKTRSKGLLKKSIGFVPLKSSRKSVFISAKIGARKYGNYKGFHGHLFDAGTSPRQSKGGQDRGQMPASGFFTDALRDQKDTMISATTQNLSDSLDKYIQRGLKRQAKAAKS